MYSIIVDDWSDCVLFVETVNKTTMLNVYNKLLLTTTKFVDYVINHAVIIVLIKLPEN